MSERECPDLVSQLAREGEESAVMLHLRHGVGYDVCRVDVT